MRRSGQGGRRSSFSIVAAMLHFWSATGAVIVLGARIAMLHLSPIDHVGLCYVITAGIRNVSPCSVLVVASRMLSRRADQALSGSRRRPGGDLLALDYRFFRAMPWQTENRSVANWLPWRQGKSTSLSGPRLLRRGITFRVFALSGSLTQIYAFREAIFVLGKERSRPYDR